MRPPCHFMVAMWRWTRGLALAPLPTLHGQAACKGSCLGPTSTSLTSLTPWFCCPDGPVRPDTPLVTTYHCPANPGTPRPMHRSPCRSQRTDALSALAPPGLMDHTTCPDVLRPHCLGAPRPTSLLLLLPTPCWSCHLACPTALQISTPHRCLWSAWATLENNISIYIFLAPKFYVIWGPLINKKVNIKKACNVRTEERERKEYTLSPYKGHLFFITYPNPSDKRGATPFSSQTSLYIHPYPLYVVKTG